MTLAVNIAQGGSNNVTMRNRIINGAMVISQRNGTTAVSSSGYFIDRFQGGSISGGTQTYAQIADAPSGFIYSIKYTNTGTTTANDYNNIGQPIEANNVYDFQWGTSTGISVTLSFWAKANNAGTYNAAIPFNGGTATYYYYPTYTINSANTWQYITITIPAPPTAAGAYTGALNAAYTYVYPIVIGSSGAGGTTANTWTTNGTYKASGVVNLASTASATFYITGVQLEAGTTASPFEYRQYGTELALCQRYCVLFAKSTGVAQEIIGAGQAWGSSNYWCAVRMPVTMRSYPTMSSTTGTNYWSWQSGGVTAYSTSLLDPGYYGSAYLGNLIYQTAVSGIPSGQGLILSAAANGATLLYTAEL
jgi:hypothetical protein